MGETWPSEVDEVLGGDLTAGLAYVTPAGGAVVTAVAPIGMRDRAAGTVTFTTSLGFGKKLERIRRNPRVALAYHAREHGFSDRPLYVLVQGLAIPAVEPDRNYLEEVLEPNVVRFMGPRKQGRLFWDRWLREYYQDRVPVTVEVERVTVWPDQRCEGPLSLHGATRPNSSPASQSPPKNGTSPRVDVDRAARRLRALPHVLLGFLDTDGHPTVVPVEVQGGEPEGVRLAAASGLLPPGSRRAGLLGHHYGAQLIGLAARQHTGWLEVRDAGGRHGLYAPHTEKGFRAPANKTLLLLANGLLAKRGMRRAARAS